MGMQLATRRGLVYEGEFNFYRAIHPIPVLTRATCVWLPSGADWPACPSPLFREDSFDPVTRIRRGRLYVRGDRPPQNLPAANVHNYPFGPHIGVGAGEWDAECFYRPIHQGDIAPATRLEAALIELGDQGFTTRWRVVATERISSGELLFTLRERSSLGALPILAESLSARDGSLVAPEPIEAALEQLVDAFHRQQPAPIADVCRETARIILAAWTGAAASAKDLKDVIKRIPNESDKREALVGAATVINRLHSRGKSSERERQATKGKDLQPPCMEDAEASVQLVGFLLRDIGWAAT